MPPLEVCDFVNRFIVWIYVRSDREGEPIVFPALELRCRWEEGQMEIPNALGSTIRLDGMLATTQDIPINSFVWKGTLQDLGAYANNVPLFNMFEIKIRSKADDLKGRSTRYEFGFSRYKNRPSLTIVPRPSGML